MGVGVLRGGIAEVLAQKTVEAAEQQGIPRIVLAGGVAANRGLRARVQELAAKRGFTSFVPPIASCTDNAAMIAYVGALKLAAGQLSDIGLAPYSRAAGLVRGKVKPEPRVKRQAS